MARELIDDGLFAPEQLVEIYDEVDEEVKRVSDQVTPGYQPKTAADVLNKVYSYNPKTAEEKWQELNRLSSPKMLLLSVGIRLLQ
jgi:TPP-dependent pyruvate/acetoin dehydrogenase alpha subunit